MQMAATTTDSQAAVPPHHPHPHPPPLQHGHPHPPHPMAQARWVVLPYPPPPPPMVAAPPPQYSKHFAAGPPPPPPAAAGRRTPTPPAAGSGGNGCEENKTIWVGDLQYWMDENYLHSCFGPSGEVVTIKVIRNRQTGQSEGYGFVEFYSHGSAEKALQNFSGHMMPNTDRPFKLNWASYSMAEKRSEVPSDYSIFVGDLAADVTDEMLMELFANKYRSVKGAKVIVDANTGRSRGYGFVRFGDDNDKSHAMTEMNGAYCSTRPIRIGPATPRRSSGDSGSSTPGHSDGDSTNRTVYVGGLDPNVSEDELRKAFAKYGDVASVKIPLGKQCGFVQFVSRTDAEEALQGLNGSVIGKQAVRLSWGRSPSHKQSRADSGNRRNNMYYGTPFYGGYGYASPVPHPNMYAAAYGAYPIYGNQQLVS
ncbi:hypothetical protein E2562_002721 [Oryza meyeriana var. granulata]|uniref:RRM domain-containing protein n=1 Tax=Oryza meyeriana var. granulata TaxID=110450 RepID=A0A6G1BQQ4_9ORYZ|nr:hypothetical protein E2562_002721 [Oryza meyeriana var. granulata]